MTTKQQEIISSLSVIVKNIFEKDSTGHDWWHIERVYKLAVKLAHEEKANVFIVSLAALLHDVDDWKFNSEGDYVKTKNILQDLNVDQESIEIVIDIIDNVSFKGLNVDTNQPTIEGKIVQDADRIDALGAIGIARAFSFGGAHGRLMHNPEHEIEQHADFKSYKNSKGPTINHFYEKLLHLKNRMQTETGKKIANNRTAYMQNYLDTFYNEWNGIL